MSPTQLGRRLDKNGKSHLSRHLGAILELPCVDTWQGSFACLRILKNKNFKQLAFRKIMTSSVITSEMNKSKFNWNKTMVDIVGEVR